MTPGAENMRNIKNLFIIFAIAAAGAVSAAGQGRERGIELFYEGSFAESAEILKKAAASDKKDKRAWTYLGAAYLKLGERKDAGKAFRRAIGLSQKRLVNPPELFERPINIIRKSPARYTDLARQQRAEGETHIAVEFKADGTIGFIVVIRSLPHGLTESAIAAAIDIEFEPAIYKGKAVPVVNIISYSFSVSVF
jgi:tetratricopeptide (TPR) repeat protein